VVNAIRGERYQYSIAEMGSKTKRAALQGKIRFLRPGLETAAATSNHIVFDFIILYGSSGERARPDPMPWIEIPDCCKAFL